MNLYFKDLWWALLLLAVCSYMIGNINFARIISKAKKKDITKEGSGNPGTMNMSRTFGLKTGVLTLVLDILKGFIPALSAFLIFRGKYFGNTDLEISEAAIYIAGFFAVLGHILPVIYKFKGGKGIATTIGVFLVGEPIITLIFAVVGIIYIFATAMGSMGSFIVTTPPAIAALIRIYKVGIKNEPSIESGLAFFIVTDLLIIGIILMTWGAHRQNIKRLLAGEEHETGWFDMIHDRYIKKKAKKILKKQKAEEKLLKEKGETNENLENNSTPTNENSSVSNDVATDENDKKI